MSNSENRVVDFLPFYSYVGKFGKVAICPRNIDLYSVGFVVFDVGLLNFIPGQDENGLG